MKKTRFSESQIVAILKEVELGAKVGETCRKRGVSDANRFIFNRLIQQKIDIEACFGAELEWLPLPEKKSCRIQYSKPVDGYNRDNWPDMIQWLVTYITRREQAVREPLKGIRPQIRLRNSTPELGDI